MRDARKNQGPGTVVRCPATTIRGIVALLLIAGALTVPHAVFAQSIRMGGTGSALGTIRLIGDAYARVDPRFSLEIVPNLGSGGAMKALERDAIHFAATSRPLTQDETGKGYRAIEYGKTPFVLATSRKGAGGLTLDQIAGIYAGKQTRWPDATPIRLVLRPANDGDTAALAAFSPAVKDALGRAMAREGMITGITDQDSATEIARLTGGLGTSSLALILSEKRDLSALAIDGVSPSAKTIADGSYPYVKTLYIVTKGNPAPPVERFIGFMGSAAGRQILADTGHSAVDMRTVAKAR